MKPVLEEALEQLKGQPKKPYSKPTVSLKDQLDPGKAVAQALKQAMGFGGEKKIPTYEELEKTKQEKGREENEQIRQVRANIELLKPPKPPPQEVPERDVKKEVTQKHKIPELVIPKSKPRRGDLYGINRKKTSIENKSGYQG